MSESENVGGAGQKRAVMTPAERGALLTQRKNAMITPLAGLLIAHGNGVATAEERAANAVRADWRTVRDELDALGWDYLRMEWRDHA